MPPRIGPLDIVPEGVGRVPTPEQLALLPSTAEIPFKVNGMSWPDGAPVVLVVRALTFEERAACNREALDAAKRQSKLSEDEAWALAVMRRALVRPKLTDAQVGVLLSLNARIIDEFNQALSVAAGIDPRDVEGYLEALAGVAVPPPPAPADGPGGDAAPGDGGEPVRAPRGRGGKRAA